jgi:hypothetical protein
MHTLIGNINSQANKRDQLLSSTISTCLAVTESKKILRESVTDLKNTLRKVVATTKTIDLHLAHSIAKTIVLVNAIRMEIIGHKNIEFKGMLGQVLDFAAQRTAQDYVVQQQDVDVIQEIKTVMSQLVGNMEMKIKVTELIDRIIDKISKQYDSNSIMDVMKLSSKIMQSNDDPEKRKQILDLIAQL